MVVSSFIVPVAVDVLPALSDAVAVRPYVPSADAEKVLPPPLMLTLETPDVASVAEALAVADDTNHPFAPLGAGMLRVKAGATESRCIEADEAYDESPNEESAQKLRFV
jgi:hypothetical protein